MNKVALLFSGQGSQYVGMGKKFYDKYASVRTIFEEASDTLGYDIAKLCFEGDIKELTKTENTQPAILTVSTAIFKVFMEEMGIKPFFFAGHSLGELSALTCAEAIDFTDAVKLVRQRGIFMQESVKEGLGEMAAISGINIDIINEVCTSCSSEENIAVISNYNSHEQTVISGHKAAVMKVCEKLEIMGGKVIPLKVSAPFHSPLMNLAAERFRTELEKYKFDKLKYPVVSNLKALPYESERCIIENLSEHLVKPVLWRESMEYLDIIGVDSIVEIGPKSVLKNLMKKNVYSIRAYSFDDNADYMMLNGIRANGDKTKDLEDVNKLLIITRCLTIAICTQNKEWDNDAYKNGVIEPYKRIKKMQEEIESRGIEPTKEQIHEAFNMLRTVFITKQTSIEEQKERFEQIFSETGAKALFDDFNIYLTNQV